MKFKNFFLIIFSLLIFSACNSDDNDVRDDNVAFLNKLHVASENSVETGIFPLSSNDWGNTGMYYKVLTPVTGDSVYAIKGQTVTIVYSNCAYISEVPYDDYLSSQSLTDNSSISIIDSNVTYQLTIGTSSIDGFSIALQSMEVGSKYRFYIPYNLAYGSSGYGTIDGYVTLIFDIEIKSIDKV